MNPLLKLLELIKEYWEGNNDTHQRFGQWYLNTHKPGDIYPDLFYERDHIKSVEMVYTMLIEEKEIQ